MDVGRVRNTCVYLASTFRFCVLADRHSEGSADPTQRTTEYMTVLRPVGAYLPGIHRPQSRFAHSHQYRTT